MMHWIRIRPGYYKAFVAERGDREIAFIERGAETGYWWAYDDVRDVALGPFLSLRAAKGAFFG